MRVASIFVRICIDPDGAFLAAVSHAEELQAEAIDLLMRRKRKRERCPSPADIENWDLDDWSWNNWQTTHRLDRGLD